jgi:hypothetical protein
MTSHISEEIGCWIMDVTSNQLLSEDCVKSLNTTVLGRRDSVQKFAQIRFVSAVRHSHLAQEFFGIVFQGLSR